MGWVQGMTRKYKILVVEDDPILRDLTRRQLKVFGFEAVLLGTAEAALEHDFSDTGLVFMDIGLPGIDGAYATQLLREKELLERRRRVPIVALTGHAEMRYAFAVGMDDYLQKPALLADIKGMLDKWVKMPSE